MNSTLTNIGIKLSEISIYFLSNIIPTFSAVAFAVSEINSFCKDHSDICDHYEYDSMDLNLVDSVNNSRNTLITVGLSGAAIIADYAIVWLLTTSINLSYKCWQQRNPESQRLAASINQAISLEVGSIEPSNSRCQFFKNFIKKVAPDNLQLFKYVLTGCALFSSAALILWNTALNTSKAICLDGDNTQCDQFFSHLNASQINDVAHLNNEVYDTIMGAGIILSAICSLMAVLSLMSIVFCIIRCRDNVKNISDYYSDSETVEEVVPLDSPETGVTFTGEFGGH